MRIPNPFLRLRVRLRWVVMELPREDVPVDALQQAGSSPHCQIREAVS